MHMYLWPRRNRGKGAPGFLASVAPVQAVLRDDVRCHMLLKAPFAYSFTAMGGDNRLLIAASATAATRRLAQRLEAEMRRVEHKYSRYRADSVTQRINAAAGGAAVAVDDETAGLLDYAAACWMQSEGRFDITSGVLRRVWDFRRPVLPSAEALAALLPLVGWEQVEWRRPWIRLPQAGMELDFGGIGKEYAADRLAALCDGRPALIDLGGDVRVTAPRATNVPWRIGIRHPRVANQVLGHVSLLEGAVATSGDYERFFIIDGHRYSHLLNPRSGWPVSGLQAATVVAPLCVVAGSLTSMALLDGVAGPARLAACGLPHLWVDAAGTVGGSPELMAGLKK